MAALSADTPRDASLVSGTTAQVINGDVAYLGGIAALCTSSHGTSASRGRTEPFSGVAGQIPAGFFSQASRTGDTSASPPTATAVDLQDQRVNLVAVTGLAGTVADNYKLVYATTDNDLTLTRPSAPNGNPVGIVIQFRTSALADVVMYGLITQLAISMGGGTRRVWTIGSINSYRASSGNIMTSVTAPCHGRILAVSAQCVEANTDADVSSTVNLEINGTNVTGGVVTLAFGDAEGDKKSGTAVTAENVFHEGDLIDVELAVGTAGTNTDPGLYALMVEYETLPGI
jgi:hypothetical protein